MSMLLLIHCMNDTVVCLFKVELGKAAETAKLGIFTDDAKKIAKGVRKPCSTFAR